MRPGRHPRQLTTRQAAAYCQVSIPTLMRWIANGALRASRTPGGHSRIELGEFQRFLRERGMPPYLEPASESRVLVADDEPEMVHLIVELLRADPEEFKLETAGDGYEALVKVGSFKPALLILDVVMPGLDGIQVCRRLKEVPESSAVTILGITAHEDAVPELLRAGAEACLVKPFDLVDFRRVVQRLLASRRAP